MTGLELVIGVQCILNVRTGEILDLESASLDDLAEARDGLGELWHARTEAARLIDAELVRRADEALAAGEDFGRTGRFTVSVDRGGAVVYDSNAMRAELMRRVKAGELPITEQAVERAFVVTQYRLDLVMWRNLCKRWPELAEIGERHTAPKRRAAHVKRRELVEATAEEVSA